MRRLRARIDSGLRSRAAAHRFGEAWRPHACLDAPWPTTDRQHIRSMRLLEWPRRNDAAGEKVQHSTGRAGSLCLRQGSARRDIAEPDRHSVPEHRLQAARGTANPIASSNHSSWTGSWCRNILGAPPGSCPPASGWPGASDDPLSAVFRPCPPSDNKSPERPSFRCMYPLCSIMASVALRPCPSPKPNFIHTGVRLDACGSLLRRLGGRRGTWGMSCLLRLSSQYARHVLPFDFPTVASCCIQPRSMPG